jgi:hypothetical protein
LSFTLEKRKEIGGSESDNYWFVDGTVFAILNFKQYCLFDREIGGLCTYLDYLTSIGRSVADGQANVDFFQAPVGHLAPTLHKQYLHDEGLLNKDQETRLQGLNASYLTNTEKWGDTYLLLYFSHGTEFVEAWIAPPDEAVESTPTLLPFSSEKLIDTIDSFRTELICCLQNCMMLRPTEY